MLHVYTFVSKALPSYKKNKSRQDESANKANNFFPGLLHLQNAEFKQCFNRSTRYIKCLLAQKASYHFQFLHFTLADQNATVQQQLWKLASVTVLIRYPRTICPF